MGDRFNAITVVLEHGIEDGTAERLLEAIRHLRGVHSVAPDVIDADNRIAGSHERHPLLRHIQDRIWAMGSASSAMRNQIDSATMQGGW